MSHPSPVGFAAIAFTVLAIACSSDETSDSSNTATGGNTGNGGSTGTAGAGVGSNVGGQNAIGGHGGAVGSAGHGGTAGSGGDAQGSGGSGGEGTGGTGGVPEGAKRVFITSTQYSGDLALHGSAADGLDGGDALCQLAADAAALGGQWRAWLSATNISAIDRIDDVGPWYRLDGTIVFQNKASIVTAGPLVSIDVDENGNDPMSSAWTGTQNSGVPDLFRCEDWTSESFQKQATTGFTTTLTLDFWTESSTHTCDFENSLYCFEQ